VAKIYGRIDTRCANVDAIGYLAGYVGNQLNTLFPAEGLQADVQQVSEILPNAIERIVPVLRSVRLFDDHQLNIYNSLQYATLLYLISNEATKIGGGHELPERLFLLNKALHAIDIFGVVAMPEVFFLSHGLGAVLGNATYGDRLVIFQNVTVGRVGDARPVIGNNVVLYPNVIISGSTFIGAGSVIAAGVVLHNVDVPENVIVRNEGSRVVFSDRKRDYVGLYLS
jgi:serine O-acetyltransferase